MPKKNLKINNGAALLLSLLITSIISLIGYRLFDATIFTSELEKRYLSNQQSLLLALSLEEYTLDFIISEENRNSLSLMTNRYDPYSPIKVSFDRGDVIAQIEDKSDCFNINVLVTNNQEINKKNINQEELKFFKNLLLSLDVTDEIVDTITSSLIDWIDYDDYPDNFNGAEDFYYANIETPYLPSNDYFKSIAEIRKVKGVTEEIYQNLKSYICTLPIGFNAININSISPLKPEILVALSDNGITNQDAINVIERRPLEGFQEIEDFFNDEFVRKTFNSNFVKKKLTTEPFYFNLNTQIKFDDLEFIMNSRFLKENDTAEIISRKIGNSL